VNSRRLLVVLLLIVAACLVILPPALAAGASFSDVPSNHPYATAIADLSGRGTISGFDDGTFRPNAAVSRQQFAKMIVKVLGLTVTGNEVCPFTDVVAQSGSDPLYPSKYVAVCAAHGITNGTSATAFNPTGSITRQQLFTMVVRAAALSDPSEGYAPDFFPSQFSLLEHFQNARKAAYAGLLSGLQGLGPAYDFSAASTRGECAQVLHNLLQHAGGSTTTSGTTGGSSTTTTSAGVFTLVKTVQVTPDDLFAGGGGFIRLGYIPATGRIVAAFGVHKLAKPFEGTTEGAKGYKVYTVDMQPTGEEGVLPREGGGDTGDLFVGDVLYDVVTTISNEKEAWLIRKFDAVTWKELARTTYTMDTPREMAGDMSIEYLNGVLDISGAYLPDGILAPAVEYSLIGTSHNFFDLDLKFLRKKTLLDTGHIVGSSTIYVDGTYYFVSANYYAGDVILMKYDKDWKYLGSKTLVKEAHWPEGLVYDGQRFYLAYLDTSLRNGADFFPYYPNVHLAAFDSDWNLVDDIAVTKYTTADNVTTGRPWILTHGSRLYVGYDAGKRSASGADDLDAGQAYVSVYDLSSP
jgi:hypothetical protein